jgi:hypothetical protein
MIRAASAMDISPLSAGLPITQSLRERLSVLVQHLGGMKADLRQIAALQG